MIEVGERGKDIKFTVDLKKKAHEFHDHNQKVLRQPRKKFLEKSKEGVKYNFRRYFGIHIFGFNFDPVDHKGATEFTRNWLEGAKRLVGG